MPYSDTVKTILKDKAYDKKFPGIRGAVHRLLDLIDSFDATRKAIHNVPTLNDHGKRLALKAEAEKVAKDFGRFSREVAHEAASLEKAKANLLPKLPAVSEAMQLALADRMSRMSDGQRAKLLASGDVDPRILSALFQLPAILHGTDQGLVDAIRNKLVVEQKPNELAHLDAKADALSLATGAVRTAKNALLGASEHSPDTPAAEKWLDGLTTPTAAELASERAAASRRELEQSDPIAASILAQLDKTQPIVKAA